MSNILNQAYEYAKARYAEFGVDTDAVIERVSKIPVSIHCWQGDDVHGFLFSGELSGGIQTTGNYPGAARNAKELMADFDQVLALTPGKKRINLHAIYAITDEKVDLDELEYRHFEKWVEYAKAHDIHIDFNPTCFSHTLVFIKKNLLMLNGCLMQKLQIPRLNILFIRSKKQSAIRTVR